MYIEMKINSFIIRYGWLLALLIIAGAILLQNVISQSRRAKENDFSLASLQSITQIVISDQQTSISIAWKDNAWIVNNDFVANSDAVDALLRVLTRLQATSPVPMSVSDSILNAINTTGTKIEVFSNRREVKSFKVLSTSTLGMKSVGLMKNAKVAYRIELPNFEGEIVSLFKLNPAYWQSNHISIPAFSSINAIEVEIPQDQENSFRIDFLGNNEVRLFALFYGVQVDEFDSNSLHRFLDHFKSITYNELLTNLSKEERAAIDYSEPDFIYTIYHNSGQKLQIKVFPIPVEEYLDELGRPVHFDLNRLYLTISNNNAVYVVSYIDFHPLLRNISHFNSKITQ
jgi:type II secretory pathway pseudopilin PulG